MFLSFSDQATRVTYFEGTWQLQSFMNIWVCFTEQIRIHSLWKTWNFTKNAWYELSNVFATQQFRCFLWLIYFYNHYLQRAGYCTNRLNRHLNCSHRGTSVPNILLYGFKTFVWISWFLFCLVKGLRFMQLIHNRTTA